MLTIKTFYAIFVCFYKNFNSITLCVAILEPSVTPYVHTHIITGEHIWLIIQRKSLRHIDLYISVTVFSAIRRSTAAANGAIFQFVTLIPMTVWTWQHDAVRILGEARVPSGLGLTHTRAALTVTPTVADLKKMY